MVEAAALLALVVGFIAIVRLTGLIGRSKEVFMIANEAVGVMRTGELDDDTKEKEVRRFAIRLFALSGQLLAGGAAAIFVPLGLVWALDRIGFLSFARVMTLALSAEFLIGSTMVIIAVIVASKLKN